MVPPLFEQADGFPRLQRQRNPVEIVALEREHLGEILFDVPVPELGAIQQHHRRGQIFLAAVMAAAGPAHQRLALHVPRQQLPDIAGGEDIGIDDRGAAFVAHQLRRREAERREGLQVLHVPDALDAAAEEFLAVAGAQEREVPHLEHAHIELVRVGRIPLQGIGGDDGADDLLLVGVDEDGGFHDRALCCAASPRAENGRAGCAVNATGCPGARVYFALFPAGKGQGLQRFAGEFRRRKPVLSV